MNKNIKMIVQDYCEHGLPEPKKEQIEQAISLVSNALHISEQEYVRYNNSFFDFFISQCSFVKKTVWIAQFLLLIFSTGIISSGQEAMSSIGIITIIIPLLFLTWIRELSRSLIFKTVEMESSTRFSLRHVLIARMIIMALSDVFLITLISTFTAYSFSMDFLQVCVYLLVPFLGAAVGCLAILNHSSARAGEYCCVAWCGLVTAAFLYLSTMKPTIYEEALLLGWYIAFILSAALVFIEGFILLRKCSRDICIQKMA